MILRIIVNFGLIMMRKTTDSSSSIIGFGGIFNEYFLILSTQRFYYIPIMPITKFLVVFDKNLSSTEIFYPFLLEQDFPLFIGSEDFIGPYLLPLFIGTT